MKNFKIESDIEVTILCTALVRDKTSILDELDRLDDNEFPNMRRLLNAQVDRRNDLINRLDKLVNPRQYE